MSLRIHKDEAYLILSQNRYSLSERIDTSMDGDFTLNVRAKAFLETIDNKHSYIIARNGLHSGISLYRINENHYNLSFNYWFYNKSDTNKETPIYKQISHQILSDEIIEYNDYTMICENNKIDCYFNEQLVGTIDFSDLDKISYSNSFFWFSCADMIGSEEHRCSGDFEYEFSFLTTRALKIDEVMHIAKNHKTHYTVVYCDELLKIKDDCSIKSSLIFMIDFNNKNIYKIWNMAFNGSFPQLYLENNIYF